MKKYDGTNKNPGYEIPYLIFSLYHEFYHVNVNAGRIAKVGTFQNTPDMGYINPQEEFLANYAAFNANLPKWHVMENYFRNVEKSTITYLLQDQNKAQLAKTYDFQLQNIIHAVPDAYKAEAQMLINSAKNNMSVKIMHMKKTLFFVLLFLIYENLQSQSINEGDSVKITFSRRHDVKIVSQLADLDFSISIDNISSKPVRVYRSLWFGKMPSPLANYDCMLYKKTNSVYEFIERYPHHPIYQYLIDSLREIYGDHAADSIFKVFDFYKDSLNTASSKTMPFNLVTNNVFLHAGEYKVRFAYRIADEHVQAGGKRMRQLKCAYSDWYYFKLEHRIVAPTL